MTRVLQMLCQNGRCPFLHGHGKDLHDRGEGRSGGATTPMNSTLFLMNFSQCAILALLVVLGTPLRAQGLAAEEIVLRSLERDRMNFERGKDYTYLQRQITRQYGKEGRLSKQESETYDVINIDGTRYRKKIAENDQPLSGKQAEKAQKEFEQELEKRRRESPEERRKRLARQEKDRREGREFLEEIPRAFRFRLLREDLVDGLPAWVIEARPEPGFQPRAKRADLLKSFEGTLWIDQKEYQWVQVQARTIRTVSFAGFLARLDPGAILEFRQTRVNNELWMPSKAHTRIEGRLALLKKVRAEVDVDWMNYRKFQTDSKLLSVEELPPPQ